MAIDFPASPTVGQEHVSGGMTYVYNGTGWTVKGGSTTDFVLKAGDTMSGDLTIAKDAPTVVLARATAGNIAMLQSTVAGKARWAVYMSNAGAETGSNSGSDFAIRSYDDAGTIVTPAPLSIVRSTGQVLLNGVPAAPLDALAYNGMQVNGSFDVSQQNGTTGTGTIGGCPADGWLLGGSGSAVVTIKQAASGPIMLGNGFSNFINVGINVASPVLASTESIAMSQRIEGVRISRLGWGFANAKPITISFWVMHVRTGLYSLAIRNFDGSRSYIATYTQNTASTWEYKTLNISGCVDGVWKVDNTVGIAISFMLGAGSAITASVANSWIAGSFFAAPGQVNAVASLSDGSNFAGVCIIPGTQAPTAQQSPLIMRPFDQELVTCQRYWRPIIPDARYWSTAAGTTFTYAYPLAPAMRAAPTMGLVAAGTVGNVTSFTFVPQPNQVRTTLVAAAAGDSFVLGSTYYADARL